MSHAGAQESNVSERQHQQQKGTNKLAIIYNKIDTKATVEKVSLAAEWPKTTTTTTTTTKKTLSLDERHKQQQQAQGVTKLAQAIKDDHDHDETKKRDLTLASKHQFVARKVFKDYQNYTILDSACGGSVSNWNQSSFGQVPSIRANQVLLGQNQVASASTTTTTATASAASAYALAANQLRRRNSLANNEQVFSALEIISEQPSCNERAKSSSLISDNKNNNNQSIISIQNATGCDEDENEIKLPVKDVRITTSGGEVSKEVKQLERSKEEKEKGQVQFSRRVASNDQVANGVEFATFDSSEPNLVPFDHQVIKQQQQDTKTVDINNKKCHRGEYESVRVENKVHNKLTSSISEQQHVFIDSNSTFWRRLSNLSRSITQRNCASLSIESTSFARNHLLQSNEQQAQSSSKLPSSSEGNKLAELEEFINNRNNQLAPEVIGYLAKLRDSLICSDWAELMQQRAAFHSTQQTSVNRLGSNMTVAAAGAAVAEAATSSSSNSTLKNAPTPTQPASGEEFSLQTGSGTKQKTQCNNENNFNNNNEKRLIKIVELPATPTTTTSQLTHDNGDLQEENIGLESMQSSQHQHHLSHHVKLSITTTNTTTTNTSNNTTHSSASSLSSCILSESTTNSEVRLKWGKKMDFLLSIIGFAVDLANIWRFPYLVYKNGGGVFLIPYLTMLIFGGIPLFFLELCLGQFVKKGPITVWNKIFPYMKGVGYCSILISWYVSFYYNVLIAWSVYFIYRSISSFGGKMPWEDCDNSWNSKDGTCVSISQLKSICSARNETLDSCRRNMFSNVSVTSPASEFFVKELSQIDQSKGLDDMGYLRPELVACLLIVYLLHYFSLFRGLETSGKVVWVTATAPYMILSILLVRGLFLPGASMGIEYYLSPKLEKLAEPIVWIDAAGQVFYSIGVGFGVHLTYASFNSHDNNCYRDCLMTSAVNALTSVYSGLVVFVYLGYMATNLGIEIDKVASEGYSLVFEVYPEALTTLPFARFWSILFFIMLLTLGIDSAMGGLEAVITGLEDEFKFAKRLSRSQLTALVIVSSFLPALISCTQGGAYTLFWFDIYSAGVSLLFSALFETIGVVYCYGLDKFILNIESMLGCRPHLFYILCWKYISPMFLFGIIFMSIATASKPVYRGYVFPNWSIVLGWMLAFSSVAAIPIVALLTWYRRGSTGQALNTPSKSPRKLRATSGADSITSGSTRKSPAHHHHQHQQGSCKQGAECNQITMATAIITSSQGEHPHRHYMKPLYSHTSSGSGGEKNREHML